MSTKLLKRFLSAINQGTAPQWLQKFVWRSWYNLMAWRWKDDQWTFMNYGWLPSAKQSAFPLDSKDEPDRAFIGLYHHLAQCVELSGKCVVEVGSGRGGGASYIARYHHPRSMVGMDFSSRAIELSKRLHRDIPGLSFLQGDAEQMPFDSDSFDVVLNVESSHCYGNMAAFVSEVVRVLKPDGYLAWVDIRGKEMLATTEKAFQHPQLTLVHSELINEGVVRALDAASERKQQAIDRISVGQGVIKQFAAMPGTPLYKGLSNGSVQYLCRVYQRNT